MERVLESGLFIDEDGNLTSQRPERGTQLVAEGGEVDDVARGLIRAHTGADTFADVEKVLDKVEGEKPKSDAGKARAKAAADTRDAEEAARQAAAEAQASGGGEQAVTTKAATGKDSK